MRIIGVDPGTLFTAYAILDCSFKQMSIVHFELIKNSSTTVLPQRLKFIYESILKAIDKFKPDEFAIETAFYSKNIQSTLKLGHARGAAILAAANKNLPISEYSPREIKKSVSGNGSASKEQVKFMVGTLLKIKNLPKKLDISDSIAIAICHWNRNSRITNKSKSWLDFIKNNPQRVKVH